MIGTAAMVPAFQLHQLTGPYEPVPLPFKSPMAVSMSIGVKLARIPRLGPTISKMLDPRRRSHDDVYPCSSSSSSPFRYDLGDGTRKPIALAASNDCREMRDGRDEAVGYLLMEQSEEMRPEAELWCARIATL